MWGKGNPCTLLVKMQIDAATVESSVQLPQKIKIETVYVSAIQYLEIYLKKPEES